jgi:small subunit ribosomal protein S6
LIGFKATPEFVAKLELQYRRDERVIRFLTFAMDKHAIAYAEKRNSKAKDPVPVREEKPAPTVRKPDLDDDIDIDIDEED